MLNTVNELKLTLSEHSCNQLDQQLWNVLEFDTRCDISFCMSENRVDPNRLVSILGLSDYAYDGLKQEMGKIK